tara:strand:+ start:1710 stop:2000 length:291 start_codon:yes stop_codon:yes gene_type:complete
MTTTDITAAIYLDTFEVDFHAAVPAYWHCHAARHIMRPLASEFPRTYEAIGAALRESGALVDYSKGERHTATQDEQEIAAAQALIPSDFLVTIDSM